MSYNKTQLPFFLKSTSGATELGMPVFQALVEPSGGYVIPHDTFTTAHLQHNLGFVLENTYVSKSKAFIVGMSSTPSLSDSPFQLEGCMIDLRIAG